MANIIDAFAALGVTGMQIDNDPKTWEEFQGNWNKVVGADDNQNAIITTNFDDLGVTWEQVETKLTELSALDDIKRLRFERDRLLKETDWVTLRSYSQGVPVPQEWADYHQALRDITNTYTSLDDVVWPEKPV